MKGIKKVSLNRTSVTIRCEDHETAKLQYEIALQQLNMAMFDQHIKASGVRDNEMFFTFKRQAPATRMYNAFLKLSEEESLKNKLKRFGKIIKNKR